MTVKAVLDIHEPVEVQRHVEGHPDVEDFALAPLESADISIGGVGFERKDWPDYVNSMKDGRLEDQVAKMGEAYDYSYVLIEGDMSDLKDLTWTSMSTASIRGHMASLTAREEYPVDGVVPCSNPALLADYAVRLARKHTEDPTTTYLPTGVVGNDEPAGKQMWGCLPHVGPELADRLYDRFGTPVQVAIKAKKVNTPNPRGNLSDRLTSVDGVGEKTAQDIADALWEGPP